MNNTKKLILIAIVLSLIPILNANAEFKDVTISQPNYDAINYVQSEGIVNGYPDGTFRPNNTINRAEFTKIFVESTKPIGLDECINKYVNNKLAYVFFPDVPKDSWFSKYVCKAKQDSFIGGYPDGTFKPTESINFAEAAKLLSKRFVPNFQDRKADIWYQPYVEALEANSAIPQTIDSPTKKITRGEVAEIMYRLKKGILNKPSASFFNATQDRSGVAIVFLYFNKPMPNELMERLTDQSWHKKGELQNGFKDCSETTHCFSNNFYFAKDWWEREAKKYSNAFNFGLNPFDTQIKLNPEEYTFEQSGFTLLAKNDDKARDELLTRIKELIPDLKKYAYISLVIYGSDFGDGENVNVGNQFYINHIFHSGINNTQNFPEQFLQFRAQEEQGFLMSWTHELFHSFGAIDKYGITPQQACRTNPDTKKEYDYRDLFCHRIPIEGGGEGFTMLNDLSQIIVSEPTAKEIGWR